MGKRRFGELELSILNTIRKLKQASVRDVYTSLGSEGSYTTIMTVMSRMADKGDLMRKREGKQFIYWIESTNALPSKGILHRIQEKIFGRESIALVRYLIETDENISHQELDEIEKLIQKRKAEQPHA